MPSILSFALFSLAAAGGPGFDHGYSDFAAFLDGAVSDAGVNYAALKGRRALLDAHLKAVAEADASTFSNTEKLAFYVNAYNGYTLQVILDEMPRSIRDLDGGSVWKKRSFPVGGSMLTLDDMEHGNARKLADGRVHAVVNCASKGCPPLPPRPLVPAGIDKQLDDAARRWVRVNAYDMSGDVLGVSKIFDWYAVDFTKWRTTDIEGATDKQDAAIGFLTAFGAEVTTSKVDWATYDWTLNQAP